MRKLPVYLLLDTSGSMYGEPIEAVKTVFKFLSALFAVIPTRLKRLTSVSLHSIIRHSKLHR